MTKTWWFWIMLALGIIIQYPFELFTYGMLLESGVAAFLGLTSGLNILEYYMWVLVLYAYHMDKLYIK